MEDFDHLLHAMRAGDPGALGKVFSILYGELCSLAQRQLRKISRDSTLDTTSLVHECYLRLARAERLALDDRAHFVGYAARVMRSICVDCVREACAKRRTASQRFETALVDSSDKEALNEQESLLLNIALQQLACTEERLAAVVALKYFSGLTDTQIGEKLGIAERTVRRDCERARLLLSSPFKNARSSRWS
jgi:RNA polymerase sigma factor (TIGR02999 family)